MKKITTEQTNTRDLSMEKSRYLTPCRKMVLVSGFGWGGKISGRNLSVFCRKKIQVVVSCLPHVKKSGPIS